MRPSTRPIDQSIVLLARYLLLVYAIIHASIKSHPDMIVLCFSSIGADQGFVGYLETMQARTIRLMIITSCEILIKYPIVQTIICSTIKAFFSGTSVFILAFSPQASGIVSFIAKRPDTTGPEKKSNIRLCSVREETRKLNCVRFEYHSS